MVEIYTIPPHIQGWGFNAGIVKRPYGWLVANRCCDPLGTWSIILQRYKEDWTLIDWWKPTGLFGIEDLRLMVHPMRPDVTLGFGTAITYDSKFKPETICMGGCIIEDLKAPCASFSNEITADFQLNPMEKNWMPFFHGNDIYMSYTLNPHMVLKLDIQNWHATRAFISTAERHQWPYGELRGSTPPIKLPDGQYLTAFHSMMTGDEFVKFFPKKHARWQKDKYYFAGFITFKDSAPFQVTAVARSAVNDLLPECLDLRRNAQVIFPMNLWIDGDDLMMVYGENDVRTNIARLPLSKVMDTLAPVHTATTPYGTLHV